MAGEESGDACVVRPVEHGLVIAVADGLGRGPGAAHVARQALRIVELSAHLSPAGLVEECHAAMHATRGVVLGIAYVDTRAGTLVWVGVGDVRALLCRASADGFANEDLLYSHNGVVGRTLPRLRPVVRKLVDGDVIVVATDGIRSALKPDLRPDQPIERVASALLEQFGVPSDDALVLVARFRGGNP
jgi:negative regulator of sigma-B (phosphoserine phosphatase)